MHARHTPGNLLQEVYRVRFRQQNLPDRGPLSCGGRPRYSLLLPGHRRHHPQVSWPAE